MVTAFAYAVVERAVVRQETVRGTIRALANPETRLRYDRFNARLDNYFAQPRAAHLRLSVEPAQR